jgi:hypothetical protein
MLEDDLFVLKLQSTSDQARVIRRLSLNHAASKRTFMKQ